MIRRYCVECGDDVLDGLHPELLETEGAVWRRLVMHVWLKHPEFITKDGKISTAWAKNYGRGNEFG